MQERISASIRKRSDAPPVDVIITPAGQISVGGEFSDGVYAAELHIAHDDRKRSVPCVMKVASKNATPESLLRQTDVHDSMLRDKLKVPRTLRVDAEHGISILTDLNMHGHVALSSNNDCSLVEKNSIVDIPRFEEYMRDICRELIRCGERGYRIAFDGIYFLFPQSATEWDFVFGDFDDITQNNDPPGKTVHHNLLFGLAEAVRRFEDRWMTREPDRRYISRLLEIMDEEYGTWSENLRSRKNADSAST